MYYDEAHVDRNGALGASPFLATVGFIRATSRHLLSNWRIWGYVPKLDVGRGRTSTMDATAKQREHHKILSVILREFQELTARGGIKTVFMGKTVVLKCFIQYIIGDTKGHNDLCGHKQTGCRTDKHSSGSFTSFGPEEFDPLTVQDVADTRGNAALLNKLGLRPGLVNAFYSLPFADKLRHIFGSTPFERLHVFLQGLYKYQVESFHDMIGEKDAGKKDKECYNNHFRSMASYLTRQNERDLVQR